MLNDRGIFATERPINTLKQIISVSCPFVENNFIN